MPAAAPRSASGASARIAVSRSSVFSTSAIRPADAFARARPVTIQDSIENAAMMRIA